jgi:hypothetical protein
VEPPRTVVDLRCLVAPCRRVVHNVVLLVHNVEGDTDPAGRGGIGAEDLLAGKEGIGEEVVHLVGKVDHGREALLLAGTAEEGIAEEVLRVGSSGVDTATEAVLGKARPGGMELVLHDSTELVLHDGTVLEVLLKAVHETFVRFARKPWTTYFHPRKAWKRFLLIPLPAA